MKRYGPLHAVPDGLAIGDPGRRHLVLGAHTVSHRDGVTVTRDIGWAELRGATLDLQTTRFPFPGAFAGAWSSLLVMITQTDPELDLKPGTAVLTTRDESVRLELDRHHPGGYWHPIVSRTQLLMERLVEDAASRSLLRQPDVVLASIVSSVRRARVA
ncbi:MULTISPECIES: hypothetical protein [Microbacterium]|uniref:Uncharacterized protein n=1 Tax=Microbacterium aquilitoris TaxID=3067307 RepID=A0ABU3GIT4_9MICO|nr:hypothetical protein [Microbacterium sp. KSW-18]MDT3330613.1 hypothetical protein [Microbacterium sp. KSW-18]